MQNSHLKNRRAVIEIAPEVLGECAQVLVDAGFEILGSATSRDLPQRVVRLVIGGDALPEACEGEDLLLITMTIQQDQYGRQRIKRIKDVMLVDGAAPVAS
jgi:hypothetical protein